MTSLLSFGAAATHGYFIRDNYLPTLTHFVINSHFSGTMDFFKCFFLLFLVFAVVMAHPSNDASKKLKKSK